MSNNPAVVKVALADDHEMVGEALGSVINGFEGYQVILTARNGKDLLERLRDGSLPDLVILDIDMPVMNGYETIRRLGDLYPGILMMALTMYDSDVSTVMLIQLGVRGVVTKEMDVHDLRRAIDTVSRNGHFFQNKRLVGLLKPVSKNIILANNISLGEKELIFLKLVCCDLSYKEIGYQMGQSVRTVENYRDALLVKLNVKSKTGLVTYAIKNGIVSKDEY